MGRMDEDELHEEKTVVEYRGETLQDLMPGTPAVAPLELVFDRDTRAAGVDRMPDAPHRALEIWTQNRIYVVDSSLVCVEIRDRKTGKAETKHSVLGARLAGGQRQYGKTVHLSRPFPVPGTEAVFQREGKRSPAGVTSKVERVVLRISVTTFVIEQEGAWDDVTSALLLPFGPPDAGNDTSGGGG